ncbi:hypothetical protein Efla_000280 [Eimeria flavescens]
MTRLPESSGDPAGPPSAQQAGHHQQQQQTERFGAAPWLQLWEVWQRGSVTPLSQGETWYVVDAGFLKGLQQQASTLKSSMTADAVAQALSNLDKFVAHSNQRLQQQQQQQAQQLQQELLIVNADLLDPESAKRGFATKRTRLAPGVERQLGFAFHVCDAPTWKVLTAWIPHDIEIPRGVYRHANRLHVEVQPLLFHVFRSVGWSASCTETQTEPTGDFVATRADTLDFAIHKLKQIAGSDVYDACLHVSFQVERRADGSLSAPPSSWSCLWDSPETPLEETDISDAVGLLLLRRGVCKCVREEPAAGRLANSEAWAHHPLALLDVGASTAASVAPPAASVQQAAAAAAGGGGGGGVSFALSSGGGAPPAASRSQSLVDVWFATGGLVGLVNLANTCFLNAAVQCLSAVLPFSRYFLSGAYRADINEQNCMGTQGRLANAYAKTLKALWASGEAAFAPRELKWAVGEVREEFLGFAQQDSQELLAFLLDGLHEDLNRVRKKPYYEDKIEGAAGASDSVTALRSWQRHKEIHDSVVVDLFQGQYRSQLVCPQCRRLSVTFDPFLNLSLPLPHAATLRFNVAGNFEASRGIAAELQAKLPLTQAKAKDFARVLRAALKDEIPHGVLMEAEKKELQRQICQSAGIHSLDDLREEHILLVCRRPGEMSPGSPALSNGLKAFSPGEEARRFFLLRCKNDKKVTNVFVWFLPPRIVQELEGASHDKQKGQDFAAEEPEVSATTAVPESDYDDAFASSSSNSSSSLHRASSPETAARPVAPEPHVACEGGGLSDHRMGGGPQAIAKKRRSTGLPLSLAATDSFFVFVAPLVKHQAEQQTSASSASQPDEHVQQKSKISGVFTQAVEAINKTFGPANADPSLRKWRLQVVFPFAAEDSERSVLGQGVAYLREKLGGHLRLIPNEEKPLTQHVRPVKGQFMALVYLDISGLDSLSTISSQTRSSLNLQQSMTAGIEFLGILRQSHKIHLADCLQLFAEREVLDQDNMWYCGTCRKHVQAQKKLDLWRMPRVLILHLKRFHNTNRWSRTKINTRVCFPYRSGEYLDMSQFILPGGLKQLQEEEPSFTPEYELIGVNVHAGELGGGHYYAYTKIRGQWYEFNDSCVTPVHEDKCHSADAYMLTYELRSSREDSKSRMVNVGTSSKAPPAFQQQPSQCPWAV